MIWPSARQWTVWGPVSFAFEITSAGSMTLCSFGRRGSSGVDDVDPAREQAGEDQEPAGSLAVAARAGIPAEVVQLVADVGHPQPVDDLRVRRRFRVDVDGREVVGLADAGPLVDGDDVGQRLGGRLGGLGRRREGAGVVGAHRRGPRPGVEDQSGRPLRRPRPGSLAVACLLSCRRYEDPGVTWGRRIKVVAARSGRRGLMTSHDGRVSDHPGKEAPRERVRAPTRCIFSRRRRGPQQGTGSPERDRCRAAFARGQRPRFQHTRRGPLR